MCDEGEKSEELRHCPNCGQGFINENERDVYTVICKNCKNILVVEGREVKEVRPMSVRWVSSQY